MVTCTACFRRLGLWLFKKPALQFGDEDDDDSSSMTRLNVVEEHRDVSVIHIWVQQDRNRHPCSIRLTVVDK